MVTPGFIPVLERVPSDGVSTRYQSEYPVLERVPCPGASTRCRSEYPVPEPSPGAGASPLCRSHHPVPEPSPGAMSTSSLRSLARHRTRPHGAWPSLRAGPTEPARRLGVCASPWLKPTGYKIGHASGINSALGK